jgi:type IV pilus assembly protein PilV
MRMRRMASPVCRRQRGFSLVEVMVALLVTAVGLLGLASLQLTSLKIGHNAHLRGQAVQLAHEIVERMRANREAARDGRYDLAYGATPAGTGVPAADLQAWRQRLQAVLPQGDGRIEVDAATMIARIAIRWDDARGDTGAENPAAGQPLEFVVATRL